jgi:putative ABC transport system ATP-binding protein
VVLARALAADAPVLVLHDPTTAVDTATETRIAAGLREVRRGRTTIVLTASPGVTASSLPLSRPCPVSRMRATRVRQ